MCINLCVYEYKKRGKLCDIQILLVKRYLFSILIFVRYIYWYVFYYFIRITQCFSYQNIVVIITYDLICLLIYPFQNVPKLVKLHGFPDPASCIFFGKCQYYDKKLQYFRGCIGYATICQKFVENLFKHTWQGCSLWHFCTHVNACS